MCGLLLSSSGGFDHGPDAEAATGSLPFFVTANAANASILIFMASGSSTQ